ncbi:hypothetical protein RchiOBHm_Chr0c01g0497711 [Rosa chinensis]|uniref:Uncharacterized protein n=1 Tax=Rosa chinensis TaxID=74649 RepID=A0A2P6SQU4_ROSCH|nr:hypothetical protein RchiOBHm_Chr0c01g0497711 [Rosa chinensis]
MKAKRSISLEEYNAEDELRFQEKKREEKSAPTSLYNLSLLPPRKSEEESNPQNTRSHLMKFNCFPLLLRIWFNWEISFHLDMMSILVLLFHGDWALHTYSISFTPP